MSLSKIFYPLLSSDSTQEDRKHPDKTEKLLTRTKHQHKYCPLCYTNLGFLKEQVQDGDQLAFLKQVQCSL